MRAVTVKREYRCDSLTLSRRIHLRQLLFVELVEGQLDWTDGVEQVAVALQTSPGGDGRALCTDEAALLQFTHILADCVGAHPHRIADGLVAGPALVGVLVLTAEQVRVDRQRTGRQPQQEYLVGQLELVHDPITLRPQCVLHSAPPWVCRDTHSTNFSLSITHLLPILRTGKSASCISS